MGKLNLVTRCAHQPDAAEPSLHKLISFRAFHAAFYAYHILSGVPRHHLVFKLNRTF